MTEPQFGRPVAPQSGAAAEAGTATESDSGIDATLAAALARIDEVTGRAPAEQVAAFTEAQQTLQATLARIDTN